MSASAYGFGDPCLPTRAKAAPTGSVWLHEIEHDGYRLMVRRRAQGVRIKTRRGYRPHLLDGLQDLREAETSLASFEGSLAQANSAIVVLDSQIAKARQDFVTGNTENPKRAPGNFKCPPWDLKLPGVCTAIWLSRSSAQGFMPARAACSGSGSRPRKEKNCATCVSVPTQPCAG